MKKTFWIMATVVLCIQLAGCAGWTMRTSVSEKPRVDQEVSGNRGFISGQAATQPKEPTFTNRKVYKLEVEVPPFSSRTKSDAAKDETAQARPRKDTEIWGNKGYFMGDPPQEAVEEEPASWKFGCIWDKRSFVRSTENAFFGSSIRPASESTTVR